MTPPPGTTVRFTPRSILFVALLLAIGGLGCGSTQLPAPETRVSRGAPEGAWSPGLAELTIDIEGVAAEGQLVRIPIAAEDVRFLEEESITLARWNEDARQFDAVRGASYDAAAGVLQAKLDSGGRYGVVGASRWSHAYDFQRRICDPGAFNLDLDRQLIDRLCLVILCAPFDAAAWGDAWQQQSGEFIPPDAVGGHFSDLCDRCTGVPRISAPECEVGVFVPGGGSVGPPELEQIPNGIENGGRAVAISIAPGDDDKMIVASETGGLFRSLNRGAGWTHVSSDHTFDFTDVHHDPTDAAVIVAGARRDTKVVNGGGIWRSDDGGGSWAQRPLSPAVATCADELTTFGLDYEAEDQRFWAATSCGVASSDDGGSTWSFLPAAPGYNHDKAYAVVVPVAGNLKVLTDAGVRVTTDGGAGWNVSNTGLPNSINKGVHNQIAVSPLDASQIYWAFNYWVWDAADEKWRGRWALYLSIDDGASWSEVFDEPGINRPPFVRIGNSPSGESDEYAVYYSNGGCTFRRATATHGSPPTFSAWTALTVDHCDVSDLAFANDGSTPLLLASDGGLHTTADGGLNWSFTGGVSAGYNALQITEVTGQMDSVLGTDLYFATQDNHIWASPNGGITWPGKRCCEGFYLSIPRQPLPPADTRFTGVSCAGCGNFISGPILSAQAGFPNPPNDAGNPKLLTPANYIHRTQVAGVDATFFDRTDNTGGSWVTRFGFPEPSKGDLPKSGGPSANPTVFTTFKMPGTTPDGEELIGIKRITDVLGTGTPIVSDVSGFGALGIFPTMFAWYKPFGVRPDDPDFLMAPDILDEVVKTTADGGVAWLPQMNLTDEVTRGGDFRFRWGRFGQVSTIAYDPDCPDRQILVGTQQAGIQRSRDGGSTWATVSGSERIPRISSFFYAGGGTVYLSSYGRGLWKLNSPCPGSAPSLIDRFRPYIVPVVYIDGVIFPLASITDPKSCPQCVYLTSRSGEILDWAIDGSGRIKSVSLSGGELETFSAAAGKIDNVVEVGTSQKRGAAYADKKLAQILKAGNQIRGLLLEEGKLRGLLIASREIVAEDLPKQKKLGPYIVVRVPADGGVSLERAGSIVVVGEGFAPEVPIEISVDGVPLELEEPVVVGKDGRFETSIPPTFGVGGHTVRVEQRVGQEVFRDAYSFNLTVEDLPAAADEVN